MADIKILDDSYESDLTEAESTELLLMCGHAIAPPLSPAAQIVLDAAIGAAESPSARRWHD